MTNALLAAGTAIAVLISLAAVGIAIASWLRPVRDYSKLRERVNDLASVRQEWDNVLRELDSKNRREERLQKAAASRAAAAEPQPETQQANGARVRTIVSIPR